MEVVSAGIPRSCPTKIISAVVEWSNQPNVAQIPYLRRLTLSGTPGGGLGLEEAPLYKTSFPCLHRLRLTTSAPIKSSLRAHMDSKRDKKNLFSTSTLC